MNVRHGMSVRVFTASGEPTQVVGVVTRVWTHEATREQHCSIAIHGRRWEGPSSLLQRIEQLNPQQQLQIPLRER